MQEHKIKLNEEVKKLIADYETRSVQIVKGLPFNQHKKLMMVEFYTNSKYLNGTINTGLEYNLTLNAQREQPFYNICNFRVTLAKTATDLDIKDVQITSDDPEHYIQSMLLQKESYEWMKKVNFSYTLNNSGQVRAKYGGALLKTTIQKDDEGEDELFIDTLDWRNVATDQVDILSGAIVETHYFTPVQLKDKEKVWTLSNINTIIKNTKKTKGQSQKYDNKEEVHNTDRIIIREVTGMFSEDYYYDFQGMDNESDDEYTYSLQHYFYAEVSGKAYPLFCEKLKESPFDYLPWEEMPGRALGRGIVEDSEEAQVWTNDAVITEKTAMDLAAKVLITTNSKQIGNNILELDNGHIFELEEGKTVEKLELMPSALGKMQEIVTRWQNQADQATSSFDANTGKQPPADTPYSQTALLNAVASKPFDYRREEAGIFWSRIWEKRIIPHLIKKLKKGHLLATDFTADELEVIDTQFAISQANARLKEAILANKIVSLEQYNSAIEGFKTMLKGQKRFLEIPDGYFDDIEAKVTVMTTGEQKNKSAILQSLSTIMGDVMKSFNPQTGKFSVLEDPVMSRIFGTILELSGAGISPVSLGIGKPISATAPAPQATPQAPTPSPVQPQQQAQVAQQ